MPAKLVDSASKSVFTCRKIALRYLKAYKPDLILGVGVGFRPEHMKDR
jgi:hypothetical protein